MSARCSPTEPACLHPLPTSPDNRHAPARALDEPASSSWLSSRSRTADAPRVAVEVRRREEGQEGIGQDGFLLELRFHPEHDDVGVSLARVRVDRVGAGVPEEEEAAAADLIYRRSNRPRLQGHAGQRTRDLMDVLHSSASRYPRAGHPPGRIERVRGARRSGVPVLVGVSPGVRGELGEARPPPPPRCHRRSRCPTPRSPTSMPAPSAGRSRWPPASSPRRPGRRRPRRRGTGRGPSARHPSRDRHRGRPRRCRRSRSGRCARTRGWWRSSPSGVRRSSTTLVSPPK